MLRILYWQINQEHFSFRLVRVVARSSAAGHANDAVHRIKLTSYTIVRR